MGKRQGEYGRREQRGCWVEQVLYNSPDRVRQGEYGTMSLMKSKSLDKEERDQRGWKAARKCCGLPRGPQCLFGTLFLLWRQCPPVQPWPLAWHGSLWKPKGDIGHVVSHSKWSRLSVTHFIVEKETGELRSLPLGCHHLGIRLFPQFTVPTLPWLPLLSNAISVDFCH